jgi:hypothetical protein
MVFHGRIIGVALPNQPDSGSEAVTEPVSSPKARAKSL